MKKYDSYKDSGIEWIGEIPSHWKIYKVKNLIDKSLYYQVGDGDHGSIKPEMYQEFGIPYIRVQNLSWSGKLILENVVFISEEIQSLNPKSKLLPNDILIAKTGATVGKLGLITDDIAEANTTSSVGKLTVDKNRFFPKYILYSFQADFFQKELWLKATEKSAQPGFNIDDFVLFKIASPQLSEQTTIANYLDYKTTQIDDLIAKKERLIQLLEEERTAIINQAVTKGLDPTVPMKDSGIEWLGEIPAHWEVKRIKHTTYVKGRIGWKGLRSDEFLEFSDSYVVTGTDFHNGRIKWETCYQVPIDRYEDDPFIKLKNDDLLITKDGTIGKIAIVKDMPKIATLNSGVFLTRPLENEYYQEFMYWILFSDVFKTFYDFNKSGSTIQHLYQNVFNEFKYPLPPMKEQTEIINHINIKTNELDLVISKTKHEIELLKEYKTALISEVVTGKVDVREEIIN